MQARQPGHGLVMHETELEPNCSKGDNPNGNPAPDRDVSQKAKRAAEKPSLSGSLSGLF